MKISYNFKKSKTVRFLTWLFIDGEKDLFKDSKLIGLLSRFNNGKLSMACIGLALACLWYESLFTRLGVSWVEGFNLGAIFLLLALLFCDKQRLRSTRATIYLLLFVLSVIISGLLAAINGLETGMILTGIMLLSQFVLAFIVASTYKSKLVFINVILLLSVPLLLVGVFQGFWGDPTSKLWVSGVETLIDARAFGFFGSPNVMGSLIMITSIMALFAFLDKKKWYYLVFEILALIVIVLTFSRSAWLGLVVGVIIALLIKNWRMVLLAPLGLLALLIPSIRQRLFVSFSQEYLVDAALDGRTWAFNNAIEIFKTSPILGTGPGSYGGQTAIYYNSPIYLRSMQSGYVALPYTDNQWLQVLAQIGVVGFICVGGFFVSHFVNNLKQYKKSGSYLSLGIMAAVIAVIVNEIFSNIWEFGAISVLSGAYLGLGNNYEV